MKGCGPNSTPFSNTSTADDRGFDRCNSIRYIKVVRTSCRFAVAVHVLVVLAYKAGEPVTSGLLAASVNTNPVVIRRLLLALQQAGLVATRKGAGCGSRLRRTPERISLDQVYRAVESDEPFARHTRKPNQGCPVGHCIQAALEEIFASAEAALERDLAKTSLADVLGSVKESCAHSGRAG